MKWRIELNGQAKILKYLQEKKFEWVGGNSYPTRCSCSCCNNKDLKRNGRRTIQAGSFLSAQRYPSESAADRNRKEDIPLLAERIPDGFCLKGGEQKKTIEEDAIVF
jgi:DNA-binding NtrC family response regulator